MTSDDIAFYEGLVFTTAGMYVGIVEDDFDDIAQFLRIKVWRALEAYDPRKSRLPRERYVFMCLKNGCKDLVKKKRRGELYVEDIRRPEEDAGDDAFEARYLAVHHDQTFGGVEGDNRALVPSTLTGVERNIVGVLYLGYSQKETAEILGLRRGEMERAVKSIRLKMEDWRPVRADAPAPRAVGARPRIVRELATPAAAAR